MYNAIKKTWSRYLLGDFPTFGGLAIFGISKKPQSFDVSLGKLLLSGEGGGLLLSEFYCMTFLRFHAVIITCKFSR